MAGDTKATVVLVVDPPALRRAGTAATTHDQFPASGPVHARDPGPWESTERGDIATSRPNCAVP